MRDLCFSENIEELDTSNSYYKGISLKNGTIIIPYVNLALSEHILNPDRTLKYIDICYLIGHKINFLSVWDDEKKIHVPIIGEAPIEPVYFWGGQNLERNSIFWDMRISCEEAFLCYTAVSNISDNPYYITTSGLDVRLSADVLNKHWNHKYLNWDGGNVGLHRP